MAAKLAGRARLGPVVRLVVLTAVPRGLTSLALPDLAALPGHEVAGVIFSDALLAGTRRSRLKRRLKKSRKIGLVGALNGIRMRRWFFDDTAKLLGLRDVHDVSAEAGVPVIHVPYVNHAEAKRQIAALNADLGISLGNGYIRSEIFSLPRMGMVNIHHEVLPEYRGAQSVIWQLHGGSSTSGYTIHRIDSTLDGGDILYQETLPIDFHATLRETVGHTCARLYAASANGLTEVINRHDELVRQARPQGSGRSFTTPSLNEYRQIARNHRMRRQQSQASQPTR